MVLDDLTARKRNAIAHPDVAGELFAERGFDATSVVTSRARVIARRRSDRGCHPAKFHGEVVIAQQAQFSPRDTQTKDDRTSIVFAVKVRLPNADQRLKAGMTADAELSW
jgi:hypothetical protein